MLIDSPRIFGITFDTVLIQGGLMSLKNDLFCSGETSRWRSALNANEPGLGAIKYLGLVCYMWISCV